MNKTKGNYVHPVDANHVFYLNYIVKIPKRKMYRLMNQLFMDQRHAYTYTTIQSLRGIFWIIISYA